MTETLNKQPHDLQPAYTPRRGKQDRRQRPPRSARGRHLLLPIVIQLVTVFGLAALFYPSASSWFATLNHNSEISGYINSVETTEAPVQQSIIDAANSYNSHIPTGMLRDPYSNGIVTDESRPDGAYSEYLQTMIVDDTDVIGEIKYPRLKIDLPIYHGTDDETISKGVGHVYGSSLPIGGSSTHSILTAHSGLATAPLFTPVLQARLHDIFQVQTLGETHYYRVTNIETILPEQTGSLGVISGKDIVTLITCTPLGSNTHRLLVQGERIAEPEINFSEMQIAGDGKTAGIPWWAIGFFGGNAAVAYLLFATPTRRAIKDLKTKRETK